MLMTVGERLVVFNVENGARAIGGVDISGWRSVPGFCKRIQISPALASEAAGGPLSDLWRRAAGILGEVSVPGARFGQRSVPAHDFSMVSQR